MRKYVLPTILVIGRLISSCGQSVYAIPKFIRFVTNNDKSPYELPAIIIAATANFLMNLFIRVPSMYLHAIPKSTAEIDQKSLRLPYYLLYMILKIIGIISVISNGIGSFLGANSFIERVTHTNEKDACDGTWKEYAIQGNALYFSAANVYSTITRPMKAYNANIYTFALHMQEGTFPKGREVGYTIALTCVGVICAPFQGYFSSSHGLKSICILGINPSDDVCHIGGAVSACSLATYTIFTQMPAVYGRLIKVRTTRVENKACIDTPLTNAVKIVNVPDSLATGANMFTAVINTSQSALKVDQRNPELIAFAATAACSTAFMQYYFSNQTFRETKADAYRICRGGPSYSELRPGYIRSRDEEAGSENNAEANASIIIEEPARVTEVEAFGQPSEPAATDDDEQRVILGFNSP